MRRIYVRIGIGLILLLIGGVLSLAQDSDTESTSFTVTLNNTVRIDINATSQDDTTIDRAEPAGSGDLYYRYFEEDTDGFAQVCLDIWAITNYQVTVTNSISCSAGAPCTSGTDLEISNALLEVQVAGFGSATTHCVNPGEPDDGTDNPVSDITADFSTNTGEDVYDGDTLNLFHGGNTEGGTDNYVTAELDFRLDLDAFEDNIQNAQYTFTLTFTITEQ